MFAYVYLFMVLTQGYIIIKTYLIIRVYNLENWCSCEW